MQIGQYLITRYCVKENLFGLSDVDMPDLTTVEGPRNLISRVQKAKSVTICRYKGKVMKSQQSEKDLKEMKRKQKVKKQTKVLECMRSEMNACQAILKPDCSNATVQKSAGITKALMSFHKLLVDGNRYSNDNPQSQETSQEGQQPRTEVDSSRPAWAILGSNTISLI